MYSGRRRSAKPAKRRRQAGVSLLEAIVTMVILGVGVLGLSASAIELSRTAKWADMNAAATSLASKQLELLRSMPLGSPAHVTGSYSAGAMEANGTAGGPYTVSWVVSNPDTPTWGLKRVIVTTAWSQYQTARNVRVGALIRCTKTPC